MNLPDIRAVAKEWLMAHIPAWLSPFSPYGEKGRPHNPKLHATANKQQELSLRLDRLAQRARHEAEARQAAELWHLERD